MKVSDVVYREDLYPRSLTAPEKVQDYAESLDVLPPIEVNQHGILIDGWHRWTAHKKVGLEEIGAVITETGSEAELLELAIVRNNAHGLQLSRRDKQDNARKLYHITPVKDRSTRKDELAKILSVSPRTVRNWLSRIDKDEKGQQRRKVFDLWLSCHSQEEIATVIGWERSTVAKEINENVINGKVAKNHTFQFTDDFTPPLYNIWKTQDKSNKVGHFGNTEQRWLENLLYLYTDPFEVVVDPFAGGGSTIDVCKRRGRRYFVSDRKPIVEREHEIRVHDLTDGLPGVPRWKDVKLVYLDPPYWKQAEGQYSDDAEDLANMALDDFNMALSGIISDFAKKLSGYGGSKYIALIIQPTQWKAPERKFVDHVGDMLRRVPYPVEMRYSVPYESQQCTAQMVEWSKENKRCLVLSREIIVWEVN